MDDTTETRTTVPEPRKRGRGFLWGFIAVVLAFGAGFGWQFYEANLVREELSRTEQELMVERLRVQLGQAAIAAQAGDYESARQRMSEFFTRLDAVQLELPDPVGEVGDEFLAMRDEVITGLSRSNAEFAGVLYGMLDRFRAAVPAEMREEGMEPAATPAGQMEPAEPAVEDTTG